MRSRLEATRQRLVEALRAGQDTKVLRQAIAQLEAACSAPVPATSPVQAAEARQRAERISARAAELVQQSTTAIDIAVRPFQESRS